VEPLLLEGQTEVGQIIESYDDGDRIAATKKLVERFVGGLNEEDCKGSFDLLSTRYQARMAAAAGSREEAVSQFCSGHKETEGQLVPCDWQELLVGRTPHHMVSPPPEMGLEAGDGEELFIVVQRDGAYTAFLVVSEGGRGGLEPF